MVQTNFNKLLDTQLLERYTITMTLNFDSVEAERDFYKNVADSMNETIFDAWDILTDIAPQDRSMRIVDAIEELASWVKGGADDEYICDDCKAKAEEDENTPTD